MITLFLAIGASVGIIGVPVAIWLIPVRAELRYRRDALAGAAARKSGGTR